LNDEVSWLKILAQQINELLEVLGPHQLLGLLELGLYVGVKLGGDGGRILSEQVEPSLQF
jgi:hypothetical protein